MKADLRSGVGAAIGWHGKLPTVGDFATRRLDPGFVTVWDDWISRGLDLLRSRNPNHWQDAYLSSPTWRFVLTAGFLPPPLHAEPWTGVLMPSVDRVGRYYPLTLAAPLRGLPVDPAGQAALWIWLQQLQDAAIDALEEDWSIETLDAELVRLGMPPGAGLQSGQSVSRAAPPQPAAPGNDPGKGVASMDGFFASCAPESAVYGRHARCVWYNNADLSAPRMECCARMDDSLVRLWVSSAAGSNSTPWGP
jgi:type VI secretion system protein ImpM